MTKESQSTYPLRLPRSLKAEVERRAKADGVSVCAWACANAQVQNSSLHRMTNVRLADISIVWFRSIQAHVR
jgi:hypothetical protein